MLRFRKIAKNDLGPIYEDETLRTILNIECKGDWFGVLIESDGKILGGLTGYKDDNKAVIQNIVILAEEDNDALLEGLLRSTIYILDREGLVVIYTEKMDDIHERVGFYKNKDISNSRNSGILDIANFFKKPCNGCNSKTGV